MCVESPRRRVFDSVSTPLRRTWTRLLRVSPPFLPSALTEIAIMTKPVTPLGV
jgi:hypothetical protein